MDRINTREARGAGVGEIVGAGVSVAVAVRVWVDVGRAVCVADGVDITAGAAIPGI